MVNEVLKSINVVPQLIAKEIDIEILNVLGLSMIEQIPVKTILQGSITNYQKNVPRKLKRMMNFDTKDSFSKHIFEVYYDPTRDSDLVSHAYITWDKEAHIYKPFLGQVTLKDRCLEVIKQYYHDRIELLKDDKLEGFLKALCIKGKPATSMVIIAGVMGLIDKLLTDFDGSRGCEFDVILRFIDDDFDLMGLSRLVTEQFLNQYYEYNTVENKARHEFLRKQENHIESLVKELDRANEKIEKQKLYLDNAKDEKLRLSKSLKKIETDQPTVEKQAIQLQENDTTINSLSIEIIELRRQLEENKKSQLNDIEIERLNNQLALSNQSLNEKNTELGQLRGELKRQKEIRFYDRLKEHLRTQLMTTDIYEVIKPYYEAFENEKIESEKIKAEPVLEVQEIQEPVWKKYMGYCIIQDNKHYIKLPNCNELREIYNIPINSYLIQNQFLAVDKDMNFKFSTATYYEPHFSDYLVDKFVKVEYINDKLKTNDLAGNVKDLSFNIPNIQLNEGQVVSLDKNGNLLRYYKNTKVNAETIEDSINAKGYKLYQIMKIFAQSMYVKNIYSREEELLNNVDCGNFEVSEGEIICVEDTKVLNCFKSKGFYTNSKYYDDIEHGIVEIRDNQVFAKKLTGEIIIVRDIPITVQLYDEQVIGIDSSNRFVRIIDNKGYLPPQEERSRKRSSNNNESRSKQESMELAKSILIVGDIHFRNAYKLAFMKIGYEAEVIEGFEPYQKIITLTKGKDLVAYIQTHATHKHYKKLKREDLDCPIIFTDNEGATSLVREVQEYEGKLSQIEKTNENCVI
jgi:hypothetical protein